MRNNVLIVDDDPVSVALISCALQEDGHTVIACEDSYSALAVFEKESIAVALIELFLPLMPGKELIKKGVELQKECKFIALSRNLDLHDFIHLQTMGVYDSFNKPADTQIIVKAVAKANKGGGRYKISVVEQVK